MIRDLADYPDGSVLETDVVLVGAGPAGIALANELQTSHLQVILVEGGGLEMEEASQDLNATRSVGLTHRHGEDGRARAFGGAGKLWAGQCLRLDEIDFTRRSWVPFSGWPFDRETLTDFYGRAETFFRVNGEVYDERVYDRFGIDPPRWATPELQSMFTVYTPELDVGATWKSRIASAPNVLLLVHANVTEIALGDSTEFSHVAVKTLSGTRAKVKAKVAVLCTGGLENPRLLLMSRGQHPDGLGNARGQVGRYFQEHPNGFTAEIVTGAETAATLQEKFRILYAKDGLRYFPKFRLGAETQRREEVLNCNASLLFEYPDGSGIGALQEIVRSFRKRELPDGLAGKLANLVRDSPEVLRALLLWARSGRSPSGKPSRIQLQCYVEQAPTPESRVCLSEETDALGLPLIAVDWHMTGLEIRTLRVLTQTVRSEFARLDLGTVVPFDWLSLGSGWEENLADCAHHCGTTRMADSPERGVVDANCKVFGLEGLYVCGSSVFPTSGYANPTLTILALSIRLADHLKATLPK